MQLKRGDVVVTPYNNDAVVVLVDERQARIVVDGEEVDVSNDRGVIVENMTTHRLELWFASELRGK